MADPEAHYTNLKKAILGDRAGAEQAALKALGDRRGGAPQQGGGGQHGGGAAQQLCAGTVLATAGLRAGRPIT